jgi:hypothetical protein
VFESRSFTSCDSCGEVTIAIPCPQAARFDLFRNPVIKQICSMLESPHGSAIVATTTVDQALLRARETDATDDIPLGMARGDNAWSTCACFTLAAVLFDLFRRGKEVGTVGPFTFISIPKA